MWKDFLQIIWTEIWYNDQKTLIHIDSSNFAMLFWLDKQRMHKIENMPLQPSSIYSRPWGSLIDEPIYFFSSKTFCVVIFW